MSQMNIWAKKTIYWKCIYWSIDTTAKPQTKDVKDWPIRIHSVKNKRLKKVGARKLKQLKLYMAQHVHSQ